MTWAVLLFLHWTMATVTALVAQRRGRSGIGFFLYGLVIWPVALAHVLLSPPGGRAGHARASAPAVSAHSAGSPRARLEVCPICRREVTALPPGAGDCPPPAAGRIETTGAAAPRAPGRSSEARNFATRRVSRFGMAAIVLAVAALGALAVAWDRTAIQRPIPVAEHSNGTAVPSATTASHGAEKITTEAICRFAIAARMGRDPSIVAIESARDGVVFLSYTHPDDGTHWAYKCRLAGNQIIWGSKDGRWRTRAMDSTLLYVIEGDRIRIEDHFTDGVYKRSFALGRSD